MAMPPSAETEAGLRPAATAIGLAASLRPTLSLQAVIGGALIGGALECLLIVLAAGVGLTVAGPGTPGGGFAIGLGIWWIISIILSMLVAGYAAARLANVPSRFDGLLHGLVVWGLGVLVALWMVMAAAGGLVNGAGSVLGGSLSLLGHGLGAVPGMVGAPGAAGGAAGGAVAGGGNTALQQAQQLLQPPSQGPANMTPQQAEAAVAQALPELAAGGPQAAEARSRIIAILSARLNISPDEAAKRVDQIQQQAAQAKQGVARAASGAAATAVAVGSGAAWAAFVALAVGAVASAVGGALARPRRVLRSDRLPIRM